MARASRRARLELASTRARTQAVAQRVRHHPAEASIATLEAAIGRS